MYILVCTDLYRLSVQASYTGGLYIHCTDESVQERSVQKRLYIAFVLKRLDIAFLKRFMIAFTYRVISFEVCSVFIHHLQRMCRSSVYVMSLFYMYVSPPRI